MPGYRHNLHITPNTVNNTWGWHCSCGKWKFNFKKEQDARDAGARHLNTAKKA
jgi:hypothetical protein